MLGGVDGETSRTLSVGYVVTIARNMERYQKLVDIRGVACF